MFRSRSWFGGGWSRPKNLHSLEHLKYLYNVLSRNQTVSENNRGLLVETLRSIAEILIWGDQNDSSVFDFFLEKNMLSFFLRIMRQRSGGSSFVCVQLLQTLNILFENIRNETSLYYLLSNNHVNSIIVHKFDFSDEEVMAYYISFLKTLSLKLNAHTIHFFYNEHTNDFPLYAEAIKFFNHPESMVRIAVRTLTLNVYRVEDASMLAFIRDRSAAPYFSNIVWFIGKHIHELDSCVRNDADHQSHNRLSDLVAEHLDHLHYLNDILCLKITDLNQVLTDHLLTKLLIPMYIYSLNSLPSPRHCNSIETATQNLARILNRPMQSPGVGGVVALPDASTGSNGSTGSGKVSCVVALFLLSQVFLIISHAPLIAALSWIILRVDSEQLARCGSGVAALMELYTCSRDKSSSTSSSATNTSTDLTVSNAQDACNGQLGMSDCNITDEEKQKQAKDGTSEGSDKPFLNVVLNSLDCSENDYSALFGLSLLFAMANNKGVRPDLLEQVLRPRKSISATKSSEETSSSTMTNSTARPGNPATPTRDIKYTYNQRIVDRLLHITLAGCQPACRVRLVTVELALKLLGQLVMCDGKNIMTERHRTMVESARTQSMALLRNFYKSEEIFLDMFEHEYFEMSKSSLNVEWLCMDSAILLPPTGTPLTGIDFTKRLPCGEVERAKRAIRVFFLVRDTVLALQTDVETQLPLTSPQSCVQLEQALDLNNSDLLACVVVWKDGTKMRRFLVIDVMQLILVEPDTKRLGWGVAKLVGFLQDIEVTGDKDDSRCLHITIHKPLSGGGGAGANRVPLLAARFLFDDNIRCMAAKQRLTKGRMKVRQKKMQHIARLLDIPGQSGPPSPAYVGANRHPTLAGRTFLPREARSLFGGSATRTMAAALPGFAAPRRAFSNEAGASGAGSGGNGGGVLLRTDAAQMRRRRESDSPSRIAMSNAKLDPGSGGSSGSSNGSMSSAGGPGNGVGARMRSRDSSANRGKSSRDSSPRMPRPRSEEIPLELIKKPLNDKGSSPANMSGLCSENNSPKIPIVSRPQTPVTLTDGNINDATAPNVLGGGGSSSNDFASSRTGSPITIAADGGSSGKIGHHPPLAAQASLASITSEETSFIGGENTALSTSAASTPRKKGSIETV